MSLAFVAVMPQKDPCQKQACAIQHCLQGTQNEDFILKTEKL